MEHDMVVNNASNYPKFFSKISRFRRQFIMWDNYNKIEVKDNPIKDNVSKYLIYICTEEDLCGGLADQIKGALISYIFANLTRRKFKAEFLKMQKCNLPRYFTSNQINWT